MRLDWAAMMRASICGLGLRPSEFWALTPAELRLMLGPTAPAPMGRARLIELCRAYPDDPGKEGS
ncbi:rcc01693 family protein [Limimaricola sp.]|uniref:rcc01693 family protein n=1 Tax=Limimaricola sp. TaxID=2211665 RepID=UPI0040599E6B